MVLMLDRTLPWGSQTVVALAMPSPERVIVLTAAGKLYVVPPGAPAKALAAIRPRSTRVGAARCPRRGARWGFCTAVERGVDQVRALASVAHMHADSSSTAPL